MSAAGKEAQRSCRVVAGEKLLAGAGGADALCAQVKKAIAAAAPKARYAAKVTVMPRSRLSTSLVVNGRALPDQKYAVMDSELGPETIQRFAEGIATAVADAAKP
jgi:hypothetical protein